MSPLDVVVPRPLLVPRLRGDDDVGVEFLISSEAVIPAQAGIEWQAASAGQLQRLQHVTGTSPFFNHVSVMRCVPVGASAARLPT